MLQQNRATSLAQKLFRADDIREHEKTAAEQLGIPMYELMEKAGAALHMHSVYALKKHSSDKTRNNARYLVLVGVGNNAGDGYVAARCALEQGNSVTLCAVYPERELIGDAATAQANWLAAGGKIHAFSTLIFENVDIVIDALLGTGAKGALHDAFLHIISEINDSGLPIVSADIPSGLCANTGKNLGQTVQATCTVTFVGKKLGTSTGFGKQSSGLLCLEGLGIDAAFAKIATSRALSIGYEDFNKLPPRAVNSHKTSHGRLLCIGGALGMSGAIRMCAEAALRAGAGMVRVFTHQDSVAQVSIGRPEIMVSSDKFEDALSWATCVVIGPGLGRDSWAEETLQLLLEHCLQHQKPLMLDADALNLTAQSRHYCNVLVELPNKVMTPHSKEASRLLGRDVEAIENDRFGCARQISKQYNTVCVLKGAGSIIEDGANTYVCENGNPGMATAGMGDVLSGIIGALLAQGLRSSMAAKFGVCLHAKSADVLAEKYGQRGLLASDLFSTIRKLVN